MYCELFEFITQQSTRGTYGKGKLFYIVHLLVLYM